MSSSKSSVIQLNDDQGPQAELQFQDFSPAESSSGIATLSPTNTYNFNDSPGTPGAESEDLLGTETKPESTSFWSFSYYQSFFNIETTEFIERLKWSFIPVTGRATFLDRQIRPKPDLYGPFWITFCLVYATAIMSNVANYFNGTLRERKSLSFNFNRVSLSAFFIYSYVFLLPIIIWGALRHFQFSNRFTLLEIICVYGYSLAIFVPISVFWIFDAAWLHWILVIVGIAVTGTVLLQIFWPIFRDDNKKAGTILLAIILICHILLGLGFGTMFFTKSVDWTSTSPAATVPATLSSHNESVKMSRSIGDTKTSVQDLIKITPTNQSLKNSNIDHLNGIEKNGNSVAKEQSEVNDTLIQGKPSQESKDVKREIIFQKI